jgi:predicted dehydrogenase
MPKTIKVGVITQAEGGHLGDYFESLAKTEEVESVALADASGKVEELARKALGKRLTHVAKDARAMLKAAEPQLVIVTMESALAPPAIDAALEAGAHVVAEKPSCVRAADMEKLVQKAHAKHRHLMLAMPNRLHGPVVEARRLVRDGALGKIYGVEVHLIADQTRLKSAEYRKEWFCSKARAGGGALAWLGILWLDTAIYIVGDKVKEVTGFAGRVGGQPVDIEDAAVLSLRFANGAFGVMTAGYYLPKGYQSHIHVWGEHGWLRLEAVEERPLEWYSTRNGADATIQRFEYAKGGRGFLNFIRAAVRVAAGATDTPPITTDETLHTVKTVFAFYDAARTGRTQGLE